MKDYENPLITAQDLIEAVSTIDPEADGRECSRCKEYKKWDDFPKDTSRPSQHRSLCKLCFAAAQRVIALMTRYNLSQADFDLLMKNQKGLCKICDKQFKVTRPAEPDDVRPCVDHDHVTGRVRGLLCDPCNRGLGHIERFAQLDVFGKIKTYLKPPKEEKPKP